MGARNAECGGRNITLGTLGVRKAEFRTICVRIFMHVLHPAVHVPHWARLRLIPRSALAEVARGQRRGARLF
jgi:hypothetical protein